MDYVCRECALEYHADAGGDGFCSDDCKQIYELGFVTCKNCRAEFPELARPPDDRYCSDECEKEDDYKQLKPMEKKRLELTRMVTIMNNLNEMPVSQYEEAMAFVKSADSAAIDRVLDLLLDALHGPNGRSL
jgi:hypothetical protein